MAIKPTTTIKPIIAIGPPGELVEDPVFPVTSSGPLVEVVVALLLVVGVSVVVVCSVPVPPFELPEDFELLLYEVEPEPDELEAEVVPEELVVPVLVVPVSVELPVPGSEGSSMGVPCPG